MNKSELVSTIARRTEMSEKDVNAVLGEFITVVGEVVAKGKDKLTIPGFISFEQTGFSAAFGAAYAFHALTIGLGEAIACYALGLPLLLSLPKIAVLRPFFGKNASYLDFPHKNV